MVVHTFNPSTWEVEVEAGRSLEFEASLVYKVSSRIARLTQRNPVSRKKKIIPWGWQDGSAGKALAMQT